MKRFTTSVACAAAILLSGVAIEAISSPAFAQTDDQVDFQTFHDVLAQSGDWVYSDRWGEVWIPTDVSDDFQPYGSNGYWAYSDYGWTWVSGYDWGDIPFHYGRWVNDPDDGWLWIPGYVWSPAWVVWRTNGRYVGWMAMPPDEAFLEGGGPSIGISFGNGLNFSLNFGSTRGYYGYSQWYGADYGANRFASNWVFVDEGHMADRNFSRYRAPRGSYATLISHGKDMTHYSVSNNYVVNRSIDPRAVQKAGGHPVPVVHLAQIMKQPQFVTTANQGQKIQSRMRSQSLRGTGIANSAPKPSASIVQSLSTNITPHNGRPTTHLFTRDTVTSAPLPAKPGGTVTPGSTTPPTDFTRRHDNMVSPTTSGPTTTQPFQNQTVVHPNSMPNGTTPTTPTSTPFTGRMRERDNQTSTPAPGIVPQAPRPPFGASPNAMGPSSGAAPPGGENGQGNPPPQRFERVRPPQPATPTGGPTQGGGGAGNQPPPQAFERRHPEQPTTPAGGPSQSGSAPNYLSPSSEHNAFMRVGPVATPPTAPTTAPAKVTPPPPPPPPQGQTNPAGKPDKKKPDDNGPPH